ncbi:Histone acetyltransferase kat6b [Boothiomyces sp. JEL0838]|nr:Histone acetyltransferase kat6b [Boothiomyces sp. JEL0838]
MIKKSSKRCFSCKKHNNRRESLICSLCADAAHLHCLAYSDKQLQKVKQKKEWHCPNCKKCVICNVVENDNKLLFCDGCDLASHTYCLDPPLKSVPAGNWVCESCKSPGSTKSTPRRERKKLENIEKHLPSLPGSKDLERSKASQGSPSRKSDSPKKIDSPKKTDSPKKVKKLKAIEEESRKRKSPESPSRSPPKKLKKEAGQVDVSSPKTESHRRAKKAATSLINDIKSYTKAVQLDLQKSPKQKPKQKASQSPQKIQVVPVVNGTPRKRGRPRKYPIQPLITDFVKSIPKTVVSRTETVEPRLILSTPPRKRGRPAKYPKPIIIKPIEIKRIKPSPVEPEPEIDPETFFNGKLTAEEADISKCTPSKADKEVYANATQLSMKADEMLMSDPGPMVPLGDDIVPSVSIARINTIQIGKYEIDTWYASPYPEEYNRLKKLYLCEFCLKYMKSEFTLKRHSHKCGFTHPPGDEIYRDKSISVFEVDGRKNKIYCQNLCLLAKTFLDHKTLYYDVEPFLFYVMTEKDEYGYHFIGYFSKEKRCHANNNKEGVCGSPERPLSDLGLLSYRYYWRNTVLKTLLENMKPMSIHDMTIITRMTADDIVRTLSELGMIYKKDDEYHIRINQAAVKEYVETQKRKGLKVNPSHLRWSPFLFKRNIEAGVKELMELDSQETKVHDI